jgi:DNA-binding NarL/FixJ family response regulator
MPAKVCLVEEQQIYRNLYELTLSPTYQIEKLPGLSIPDTICQSVLKNKPEILIVSNRRTDTQLLDSMINIRKQCPGIGIILLFAFERQVNVELVRKLASFGTGGLALFLKQSVDSTEQFGSIVNAVASGQVILDPGISALLISNKPKCALLKQMTTREQEILSLVAGGYTNAAIADALFIDLKTVEHHINNMYDKLKSTVSFEEKHPRVHAARLYLEAVGDLQDVSSTEKQN